MLGLKRSPFMGGGARLKSCWPGLVLMVWGTWKADWGRLWDFVSYFREIGLMATGKLIEGRVVGGPALT